MNSSPYSPPTESSQPSESFHAPETCLPAWGHVDLPEPPLLSWRHWTRFIGPGIVMMGVQIGGGEWLFGPDITAKYGGGLMWIATIAIIVQVFYNIECGRYALYCGEPVFTGFMRTRPGPAFWMGVVFILNLGALIPGLSTQAAAMITAFILDRPPGEDDKGIIHMWSYITLVAVVLPVLLGGKIYNMLQWVMTTKVVVVLGFCLLMGVLFVKPANWANVFSGFLKFGTVPVVQKESDAKNETMRKPTVNVLSHLLSEGTFPAIAFGNIALLGAFAGYAGGGGLANATYSNFVRDKGWGMGHQVGAIPSAIGGRRITLSHLGKIFPINADNLRRWRGWWRYVLTDQVCVWAPGCFIGMALPALLSMEFAQFSPLRESSLPWTQALIIADGVRHYPRFGEIAGFMWTATILVGLLVLLPSQMSVVDDVSRRWTDIFWSGSRKVRESMKGNEVKWIYYSILAFYTFWSIVCQFVFNTYATPRLMVVLIANLGNVAIGATSFHILWINCRLIPPQLRPKWYQRIGITACGVFYIGLALLVFSNIMLKLLRGEAL